MINQKTIAKDWYGRHSKNRPNIIPVPLSDKKKYFAEQCDLIFFFQIATQMGLISGLEVELNQKKSAQEDLRQKVTRVLQGVDFINGFVDPKAPFSLLSRWFHNFS